jgi:hypothetical protein
LIQALLGILGRIIISGAGSGMGIDAKKGVILFPIVSTAKLEPKILASERLTLAEVGELLLGRLLVLFEGDGVQLASKAVNAIEATYLNFMAWVSHNK